MASCGNSSTPWQDTTYCVQCDLPKRHTGPHEGVNLKDENRRWRWRWGRHQTCHMTPVGRKVHHPNDPMWVIGCIDANGAITARVAKSGQSMMHEPAESRGKRWRWNIWGQEFHCTRNPTLDRMEPGEYAAVNDWLERHGHKYPEI